MFIDDYSHFTTLYLQKAKSDTFKLYCAFEGAFKAWLNTQFETKVKWLYFDHSGEYMSEQFDTYLKFRGTECYIIAHDMLKHNEVAEQLN